MQQWIIEWKKEILSGKRIDGHYSQVINRMFLDVFNSDSYKSLTVEEMASSVFISRRQLYRITQKFFGTSPGKLIQEARLRRAEWILRHGKCTTVTECARMIGFINVYHFSQAFRRRFQTPPTQYLN